MASPEASHNGWHWGEPSTIVIEVPLPEDPSDLDKEWCDWFNIVHGDGKMRTSIGAKRCFRETLGPHGMPVPGLKRYNAIRFEIEEDEVVFISGKLLKLSMISDFGIPSRLYPHAVLKEVELIDAQMPLSDHSHQEFMVPLDDTDSLVLYS